MDNKHSFVSLKFSLFLSIYNVCVPANTPVKDWGIEIERILFGLLNLCLISKVATVVEELFFDFNFKIVLSCDTVLNALIEI
jgi:hypothetical protein